MPHAEAVAELPVDVDTLWQRIGSFQGVANWHPMLARVDGDGDVPGATRTATAEDGSQQRGDGASTVRWSADFQTASGSDQQALDMVQGFLTAGLDNLKERHA